MQPVIRPYRPGDATALAAIYAHHVAHGTASYETEPPGEAEMARRLATVVEAGWPALIAEIGGRVAGYAYATQYRPRPAYAYACEDSIYVDQALVGRGVGKALLAALIEACAALGFRQMVAVVGGAEPASIALHEALGFREVGRLPGLGWKHGRWLDSVYLQRPLGVGTGSPP
ncbi:GNAT family N-acetyltransferase [Sphingomonas astaxanthinifaciens]|uniref:N-acetyltransferase n=1 Tax=Sphingomonas astaxanthinifaciens DSM 22298 TaxID=1123267 RepID=A0ABQ5Z600_9SPHN|nr:GNAT family N-acetyltransferase [Sphingomonas astaxanthinifaciens]GLR47445.1 N-acetyltransferase [Sphingomonas astaxanthinifaciens DSM 22298]